MTEKDFENEGKFLAETVGQFGTLKRLGNEFAFIKLLLPVKGLDVMVYGPFEASDGRHIVFASWKKEGDATVEERLKTYAENLLGPHYFIARWPKAEGNVTIGDLKLKNTHHRVLVIWYK